MFLPDHVSAPAASSQFSRTAQLTFNHDWQFQRDLADGADQVHRLADNWERVDLPHTARLEPLVTTAQWQGRCCYRKFFSLPAAAAAGYVGVRFEAAMHEAQVYLDGRLVVEHAGGYLPFVADLTGAIAPDRTHCLLVCLDNRDNPEIPPGKPVAGLDFHYYGGLYRGVALVLQDRLRITDPVAAGRVAGGGVNVRCTGVSRRGATVRFAVDVANGHPHDCAARVRGKLLDAAGRVAGRALTNLERVASGGHQVFDGAIRLARPRRWSPDDPHVYRLEVELLQKGRAIDRAVQAVGVRTVRFSPGGFALNGRKLWLRGANRHQEYPYLGYALSDAAQWRDAWKIKAGGFNFVRCSHYPPAPAFLDACDALGLLVMDAIPGWQFFGNERFQRRALQDIRDMVRRDRHHPAIVAWEPSLNETIVPVDFARRAHGAVKEELPGRDAYTSGFMDDCYDLFAPARVHDPSGRHWEGHAGPRPLLIAEYGDWEYYADNAGFQQTRFQDLKPEERSSRQRRGDGEIRLAQQARNFQEAHNSNLRTPAVGAAIWAMFDYNRGYAADIEASGPMDIFRLPKPVYYFYQSQAGAAGGRAGFGRPMVHLASHWTSAASRQVVVYSNCEEVELRLDGRRLARRKPDRGPNCDRLAHPPFTFELEAFTPGRLEAIGFIRGRRRARHLRVTPGAPQRLQLSVDESGCPVQAAKNDVVFVHAEIVDAGGNLVVDATRPVRFAIAGDAWLVGDNPATAEAGVASVLLRAGRRPGPVRVSASAPGLTPATLVLEVVS